VIRPARLDEAGTLSALAFRSKAVWGYSDDFMAACRAELSVSPDEITARPTFVFERDGAPRGFYTLRELTPDRVDLDFLFVDPTCMHVGIGRRLVEHAKGEARRHGYRVIVVQSDPHAEPFYVACGGRRVGTEPSRSIPGRELPLLEIDLAG
jgi:GNAT superfamily N-acetyltransferase